MGTIKEEAKDYKPQASITIADLEAVSTEQEIKHRTKKNRDGEEYQEAYINVLGVEYRVPSSVLEQIQAILKEIPDMKTFSVTKSGEGMNTKYMVVKLE